MPLEGRVNARRMLATFRRRFQAERDGGVSLVLPWNKNAAGEHARRLFSLRVHTCPCLAGLHTRHTTEAACVALL